jgi:hypothetical protein
LLTYIHIIQIMNRRQSKRTKTNIWKIMTKIFLKLIINKPQSQEIRYLKQSNRIYKKLHLWYHNLYLNILHYRKSNQWNNLERSKGSHKGKNKK